MRPTRASIRCAAFEELTGLQVYGILQLRCDVFVVEQACVYLDVDGRDTEPNTLHMWSEHHQRIEAYLRVLDDGNARRIGRVVTCVDRRSSGIAAALVSRALESTDAPWVLDAQSHLTGWYARFGFSAAGPEFVEDGIAHTPMRRDR